MIQRVTITRTEVKTSPADAQKPWKKLGIQTKENGDRWIGAFFSKYNEKTLSGLKEGDSIELVIESSPDGKYLNFRLPTQIDRLEVRVSALESKAGIEKDEPSLDDVNPDDIPF